MMPDRQDLSAGRSNGNEKSHSLLKEDVTDFIEQARHENSIPAMAAVVMDSERLLIADIQGERVVGSNDAATLDDYFHIGSCTKSILAVIAGRLIEQGRLNWRTRFFDLFPELQAAARDDYLAITLEELLLCRAGIAPFTAGEDYTRLDASTTESRHAFIAYLVRQEPAAKRTKRGFKHLYSNASYAMAAAMVERVTDLTWEELILQTLSKDLQLPVIFGWPNNHHRNQPWGHAEIDGTLKALSPDHEYRLPEIIAPAGDLSLKPLDYANYVQLHLRGLRGEDNYLAAETYRTIHYRQRGFSLGVANAASWGERYSMFDGSAGTFYCATMVFPDSNLAFVIMTNSGTAQAVKGITWVSKKIIKKYFNLWWMFWM
ncbi:MAG: beta-lactamase family protein [Candidatus Thiodiazotropha sp. (ex Ctena orbiculata)]|nr:beta-lactamase family protein [Candidatus Thiodiazotropha taylori]